jgi:hypothetical protein
MSLAAEQSVALLKYPVSIELAAGFRRASAWRPLTSAEREAAEAKRVTQQWNAKAILRESEAYWSRS